MYTEDKFEDEEDMRERTRISMQHMAQDGSKDNHTELDVTLEQLAQLAKQHGEIYPVMVDIVHSYCQILERETGK